MIVVKSAVEANSVDVVEYERRSNYCYSVDTIS